MTEITGVETKFYLDKIVTQINSATKASAIAIAHLVEGETKDNIRDNRQVDTGFMVNSVYVKSSGVSGYADAKAAAQAKNPSTTVRRIIGRLIPSMPTW